MMQILLLFLFLPVIYMSNFIGTATVKLQRLEKCGEDGPEAFVNFSITSFNRTHQGVNVYLVSPVLFGEGTQLNASVAKWGDGGWKPHVLDVYETNACEFFMKYAKSKFNALLKDHGQPEKCPVAKGTYQVVDYIYDGTVDVPIMFGDFMVDMILSQDGVAMTCVKVFFHSDPRHKMEMG